MERVKLREERPSHGDRPHGISLRARRWNSPFKLFIRERTLSRESVSDKIKLSFR